MARLLAKTAALGIAANGTAASDDGPVYLWPENAPAWHAFLGLQTQWSIGFGGIDGLRYGDVLEHLRETIPDADERREVYAGVRACERAVLDVVAERRRRDAARKG